MNEIAKVITPEVMPHNTAIDFVPSKLRSWFDDSVYKVLWARASMLANSNMIPSQFQRKPEDCMIVMQMALRMNIDPWLALQNIYVVHGRPSMSAQMCIALANEAGVFKKQISWKKTGSGENLTVTASAIMRDDTEASITLSVKNAIDSGWTKGSAHWAGDPEKMLRYRTATGLIRAYAPEVLLGIIAHEEREPEPEVVEVTPVNALMAKVAEVNQTSKPVVKETVAETAKTDVKETPQVTVTEKAAAQPEQTASETDDSYLEV